MEVRAIKDCSYFLVQYQKCKCLNSILSKKIYIYIKNTHHVILETDLKLKDKTKFKNR